MLQVRTDPFIVLGVPVHLHADNGPAFTARAVRTWLRRVESQTLFIDPGTPWGNGYVESFNGKQLTRYARNPEFERSPRHTATADGRSKREMIRALNRYVARDLYLLGAISSSRSEGT